MKKLFVILALAVASFGITFINPSVAHAKKIIAYVEIEGSIAWVHYTDGTVVGLNL